MAQLLSAQRYSALFLLVNFVPLLLIQNQVPGMLAWNELLSRHMKVYMTKFFLKNFHFSFFFCFVVFVCEIASGAKLRFASLCLHAFYELTSNSVAKRLASSAFQLRMCWLRNSSSEFFF